MPDIIVDTNVLVAALTSSQGASREVLRRVLQGRKRALISLTLFKEYEDVLSRKDIVQMSPLKPREQSALIDAFLAQTVLVEVYFSWRPNLRDEGDNHVMELAVAAGDATVITHNTRDFSGAELKFPSVSVLTPAQWLKLGD